MVEIDVSVFIIKLPGTIQLDLGSSGNCKLIVELYDSTKILELDML